MIDRLQAGDDAGNARVPADQRLALDPYDLSALAERLLDHLHAGRFPAAQAALNHLISLRGRLFTRRLLGQLVQQERRLVKEAGIFFCDPPPAGCLVQDIVAALDAGSHFFDAERPIILVHCTEQLNGIFLTQREFPGFAVISISARSPRFPNELRATIFHEIAHAFMVSGSLFLDEGLATFFAARFSGGSEVFPRSDAAGPKTIDRPLRSLLSARGEDGILFEGSDVTVEETGSLRMRAAHFIGRLYERLGMAQLKILFDTLARHDDPAQTALLIEQAIGVPLESMEPTSAVIADEAGLCADGHAAICAAWQSRTLAPLDRVIEAVRAATGTTRSPALCEVLVSALIAEARILAGQGEKVASEKLAEIDALLAQLGRDGLASARLWTLKGHREALQILMVKPNMVRVGLAAQRAAFAYSKAFAQTPDDPDLLVNMGFIEIQTPEQYGGSKAKGLDLIRKAVGPSLYGQHALFVLERFGVATTPEASIETAVSQEAAPAFADHPPLLTVRGVAATVKAFALSVDALDLQAGEQVAFVGPNGAGKSLLMEVLLGLRPRTGGTITVCGHRIEEVMRHPSLRRAIGTQLQDVQMMANLRIRELVGLHTSLYGMPQAAITEALGMAELLPLQHYMLSRGQKQRVQLYLALAHDPDLVFLDEPTLGLDEWHARALRGIWRARALRGKGSVMISHVAADLRHADRILCLDQGAVRDMGTLDALIERHVGLFRASIAGDLPPTLQADYAALSGLQRLETDQNGHVVLYGGAGFDLAFRGFINRHAITTFSLEPTRPEDFLAQMSRG